MLISFQTISSINYDTTGPWLQRRRQNVGNYFLVQPTTTQTRSYSCINNLIRTKSLYLCAHHPRHRFLFFSLEKQDVAPDSRFS